MHKPPCCSFPQVLAVSKMALKDIREEEDVLEYVLESTSVIIGAGIKVEARPHAHPVRQVT